MQSCPMMINVRDMICMVTWELMKPSGDLNRILRRYSRILDLVASRTFLNNSSEEVFRLRVSARPLWIWIQFWWKEKEGQDVLSDLEVTVEDIAKGKKEKRSRFHFLDCAIIVTELVPAFQVQKVIKCGTCDGQGQTRRVYNQNRFSTFVTLETCRKCNGRGEIIEKPCPASKATGKVQETRKLVIDVPPGVDEGMTLQMKGAGMPVESGYSGDLLVRIHVKPHEYYERLEGGHLLYTVNIRYTEISFLEQTLKVPTLNGEEKVKIPAGSKVDSMFRLKGRGLPSYGNRSKGDMVIKTGCWNSDKDFPKDKDGFWKNYINQEIFNTRYSKKDYYSLTL